MSALLHTLSEMRKNRSLWVWLLFLLAGIAVTLRNVLMPSDGPFGHFNNYIIFQNAFYHWWEVKNLYISYPSEQYDLFKYSPFFAMCFGAFAWLPPKLGLLLWNLLNFSVLAYALQKLKLQPAQLLAFGLMLIQETITAGINSQSNALIAGLLILAFTSLEKDKWWQAAFFISATVFIKLFGILFFALFLCYPKWYRGIVPALVICTGMLLLPAISGGIRGFTMQLQGYMDLLANDHNTFVKYSVMGWLQSWFGLQPNKNLVVISGLLLQLAITVYISLKNTQYASRAILAGTWLIWMVIFNHMAESATFVIAVVGVLLWFFYSQFPKYIKLAVLVFVLAFTCFGPSDLYPPAWRQLIVIDWQLKVFPCILAWAVAIIELLKGSISSEAKQPPLPL